MAQQRRRDRGGEAAARERHADVAKRERHADAAVRERVREGEKVDPSLLLRAVVVGALAGGVGSLFRLALTAVEHGRAAVVAALGEGALAAVASAAVTAAMLGTGVFLVRRIAPEAAGSGIQEIEGALDGVRPLRWRRILPLKFGAGLLALGSGAVLGREGPTIQMGAALGRMSGELTEAGEDRTHCLTSAGAGAGLAATFNAPLSGVLFVIEEMRPQFRYGHVTVAAVLLACVASDLVVRLVLGGQSFIAMPPLAPPDPSLLWLYVGFGLVAGAVGVTFNRALMATLEGFGAIPGAGQMAAAVAVGAGIGFLVWAAPETVFGGEDLVQRMLATPLAPMALGLLFLARFATFMASYGCGAPGGLFAPMLALGTLGGLAFGLVLNDLRPDLVPQPEAFALAGMAALFVATVRAPLTGVALAVEITGNFDQILALLGAAAGAATAAHALGGRPIYTDLLQRTLARAGLRTG